MGVEEVRSNLISIIQSHNPSGYQSEIKHGHFILKLPKDKKRFWTPQMDLSLQEEAGKTVISCLISPEPGIWTLFMFIYVLSGFGIFIGLIIASSQVTLEHHPWGFSLALASAVLGILFYLIARIGKHLAFDERKAFYLFIRQIQKCNHRDKTESL